MLRVPAIGLTDLTTHHARRPHRALTDHVNRKRLLCTVLAACRHFNLGAVKLVSQHIALALMALGQPEDGDVHQIAPVLARDAV